MSRPRSSWRWWRPWRVRALPRPGLGWPGRRRRHRPRRRPSSTFVQWKPASAPVAGVHSEEEAGRVEPWLLQAVRQVGRGPTALLGVVREGLAVHLEPRRVVLSRHKCPYGDARPARPVRAEVPWYGGGSTALVRPPGRVDSPVRRSQAVVRAPRPGAGRHRGRAACGVAPYRCRGVWLWGRPPTRPSRPVRGRRTRSGFGRSAGRSPRSCPGRLRTRGRGGRRGVRRRGGAGCARRADGRRRSVLPSGRVP